MAIVAGVVGGILTYLYVGPLSGLGLVIPATFVGAASYFAAGGEVASLQKSLAANVWGIVAGTTALVLLGLVSSPLVIGVVVGAVTLVMILGALGLDTTAGFGLLTKASGTDFSLPTGPFTVMLLSYVTAASTASSAASSSAGCSRPPPRPPPPPRRRPDRHPAFLPVLDKSCWRHGKWTP